MALTPCGLSVVLRAVVDVEFEVERAADDFVGGRLEHAALGVGARVHAEHVAAGRHQLPRAGARGSEDDDPRVVERRVRCVRDAGARIERGRRCSGPCRTVDDGEAEPQVLAVGDDLRRRCRSTRSAHRPAPRRGRDRARAPRVPASSDAAARRIAREIVDAKRSRRRRRRHAPMPALPFGGRAVAATPALRTSIPSAELSGPWFVSPLSRSMKGTRLPK